MFQSFIQEQVDTLAERLQRSIAIDDVDINLIAASKHFGDADPIRITAMLERTLNKETIEYLYSFGIIENQEPVTRIQPNEKLGVRERYCYPIRHDDELLGFFWLLGTVTDQEHAIAIKAANELALPLLGLKMSREKEFLDQESLARDLISDNPNRVSCAIYLLTKQDRLFVDEDYQVICISFESTISSHMEKDFRLLTQVLSNTPLKHGSDLPSFRYPFLVKMASELLIIAPSQSIDEKYIDFILKQSVFSTIKIGIGYEVSMLDLYASYLQASTIAHILQTLPHFKVVATWEDLGIYGHLMTYLLESKQGMTCMPIFLKINNLHLHDEGLVHTLEIFLDKAGNINETAGQLNIHRSTLYYRLSKIEEITQTDLHSGQDRLLLHLEVKLWRLLAHLHISESPHLL